MLWGLSLCHGLAGLVIYDQKQTIDKGESWLEGKGCALMWEGGIKQGRERVKGVAEALEWPVTGKWWRS